MLPSYSLLLKFLPFKTPLPLFLYRLLHFILYSYFIMFPFLRFFKLVPLTFNYFCSELILDILYGATPQTINFYSRCNIYN